MEKLEPSGVMRGASGVWRCFYTERRRESIAAESLSHLGEVLAPKCQFYQTYSSQHAQRLIVEPLFPRYVLARITDEALSLTKRLHGVRHVVRFAGEPARVPDFVIEELKLIADNGMVDLRQPLVIGQRVRILDGAFSEQEGTLQAEAEDRVAILMDILGRPTRITLPRLSIQPLYA